jgi:4-amino-4-deoxy-L-arabinose transferase-like glycosyltransferase
MGLFLEYITIIGGHIICMIGGIILLMPISEKIVGRFFLAFACLIVPLTIPYMFIFGLYVSGELVFASIPALISLIMLIYYFKKAFLSRRRIVFGQIAIVFILMVSIIWAHYFNIYSAHHCFMGACC